MKNQEVISEKSLVINANGYVFTVNPETDIIETCVRKTDNSIIKESIGETFESYIGEKAVLYIEKMKKKFNQKPSNENQRKKVYVKNNNGEKRNYNNQERKPFNKNNNREQNNENGKQFQRKPFHKKQKVKVLIPSQPVFQPHHLEATLASYIEKDPNAKSKERFCIISSFNNCIDTKMFEDLGFSYYLLKPEDNLAWIQVEGENKKLFSKRNPLFPWSLSWVIKLFSKYVDFLILPANRYILSSAIRSNFQINLLIPTLETKESYLNLISEENKHLRATLSKKYEQFVSEVDHYRNKEKYSNVNYIDLNSENVYITKENIQSLSLVYNEKQNKD